MRTMLPLALSAAVLAGLLSARGGTTIDPAHPHAYGANIGWLDARGDVAHGVVIGTAYCTGYVWSANCGWIALGNGPTNGWQYGNAAADDWGVNHDGAGRLTGCAWGANIGWLTFEQTWGQPRVNLRTGNLSGHVWGANVGWISLANAQAYVRTSTLDTGPDSDLDGIPDTYEYRHAGDLATLSAGGHDADLDSVPDTDEAGADTDPLDDGDFFAITALECADGSNTLAWTSRPTRLYRVEATNILAAAGGDWTDVGGGLLGPPDSSPFQVSIDTAGDPRRFYRVGVIRPLQP